MKNIAALINDDPNLSTVQRIRAYYNDFETKRVTDVMIKNGAAARSLATVRSRLMRGENIADALHGQIGGKIELDNCQYEVLEFLNNNLFKWFSVAQIARECKIIILAASRAYDIIANCEAAQVDLIGRKRMIRLTEFVDEFDGNEKINFVKKASHIPPVDTKSINPNWFISKRF